MALMGQYQYIIDREHPRANGDGCVYQHVVVAEAKLGRFLYPDEVVHHKDLDKLNNDPDNLMVFATKSDHTAFHKLHCDETLLEMNSDGAYVCKRKEYRCIDCGAPITFGARRCINCSRKQVHIKKHGKVVVRTVEIPPKEELYNLLVSNKGNFTKVSKLFGVTDNGVRKWCKKHNIPYHSSDYKKL